MSVKIISANVRGLRNREKRRSIFEFYRKRADFICLQETHSEKSDELFWRNEYGSDIVFSHCSSGSRGVCILLPRHKNYTFKRFKSDIEGRIVICEIEMAGEPIVICNIYGPNKDEPRFYINMFQMLEDFSENKIIIGDYNLVIDPKIDRKNSTLNFKNAATIIKEASQEMLLVDVWRMQNLETQRYSWFRGAQCASRIDFALVESGSCQ